MIINISGSECINWFCKKTKPVIDEDGEKIDNPMLLFGIFLRSGIRAIYKQSVLIDNPDREDSDDEASNVPKVRAFVFIISGKLKKMFIKPRGNTIKDIF